MIYDANRIRCWDAKPGYVGVCPDCGEELVAKRGELISWHWAHKALVDGRERDCFSEESAWHLTMKEAITQSQGWTIEVPINAGGKRWRVDAQHERGQCVEFVHSLSKRYVEKHFALAAEGVRVLWIFDGAEFASTYRKPSKHGGWWRLLTPNAFFMASELGAMAEHDTEFWRIHPKWDQPRRDLWVHAPQITRLAENLRHVLGKRLEIPKFPGMAPEVHKRLEESWMTIPTAKEITG